MQTISSVFSSVKVNGCVDHTAVAEKFAVHFTKAYSCNNANCADELNKEYVEMRAAYQGFPLTDSYDLETRQ